MQKEKILFILKRNHTSGGQQYCHEIKSSGLLNSVKFVVDMLRQGGMAADYVIVTDNNDIDREVTKYQPTYVIIEALWVVPDKFDVLTRLHPNVRWIVRIHSSIAFLANEGSAMGWLMKYVEKDNVFISSNHLGTTEVLMEQVSIHNQAANKVLYLPNYYPLHNPQIRPRAQFKPYLDIACFGAIRPLKNQLMQAAAAMQFAEDENKSLRFHVNGTRCEQGGESVLKNLRNMFNGTRHELREHDWVDRKELIHLLRGMDIGMQVSFSETFNIVSADYLQAGLPIVVSPQIVWASPLSYADPTDADGIQTALINSEGFFRTFRYKANLAGLQKYNDASRRIWLNK